MTTKIYSLNTDRLLKNPEAACIITMMLAVNDICVLDSLRQRIVKERNETPSSDQNRNLLDTQEKLLMRIQQGLLYESLLLLRDHISKRSSIMQAIAVIPELQTLWDSTIEHANAKELLRLRNNAAFHYNPRNLKIAKLITDAAAGESRKVVKTSPMMHHWYGLAEIARARIITDEATKILHETGNLLDDGLATITASFALGRWLDIVRADVTGLMISIIDQFIEVSLEEQ